MPFLTGIFLGLGFSFYHLMFLLEAIIFLSFLSFIILNVGYKRWEIYRKPWIGNLLIFVFLFSTGIFSAENHKEINRNDHFSKQQAEFLLIKITQEPKQTGNIVRFNTSVLHTVFMGKILEGSGSLLIAVNLNPAKKSNLNYGDELLVQSNYKAIDAPFNPAEFNYQNYLSRQNIHYQAFINPNQYQLIAKNRGNRLISFALATRQNLVQKLRKYLRDPNAIAVASTLILGYRADLSTDLRQAYSKTGTMHVLSVSGMHVALVYLLIDLILRFLGRKRSNLILKAFVSIILIWIYALITGFSPSVCRAAVMITLVILGKTYNKHISTLNILLVSAFLLLLYNPFYLTDVGFQLSYLAVFGLLILQPVIEKQFDFKQKFARKTWSLISVSLAAQIITFPVSIFYFHQFPVYFLISNLFIVLPSMLVMYVGIAFLLIPELHWITRFLAFVLEKTILLMNEVLDWIEHVPFGNWNKIWISAPEYLLLYGLICCFFVWTVHRKPLLLKIAAVFSILFLTIFSLKKIRRDQQEDITFLNLQNHLGIVFKKGNKAVVMTDLTEKDKSFQYSVQPYLDSCKIADVKIIGVEENYQNGFFSRQKQLVQFGKLMIFIFDKETEHRIFPQKIKTDAVFITGNPRISLSEITQKFVFDWLIIGTKNPDYLINKLSEEAENDGRKIKILKRNKSFRIGSND